MDRRIRHLIYIENKGAKISSLYPVPSSCFNRLKAVEKSQRSYEMLIDKFPSKDPLKEPLESIYKFLIKKFPDLGLRYDLTVSLARVVAQHSDRLPKPFKRYQIAPVWRADRPQRGRYREFIQCDVDIVGTDSMVADAEIISLVIDVFNELKLPAFDVQVNHRGLLKALSTACGNPSGKYTDFCTALDKLNKIGKDGVQEEMQQRQLSTNRLSKLWELADKQCYINQAEELTDLFRNLREFVGTGESDVISLQQLEELFRLLNGLGIPENIVKFDPTLARGLDYYTGPVFEIFGHDKSIGSLGGGGRYDELVGMFSKQAIPATGTSFGLERIVDLLVEQGTISPGKSSLDVEIIDMENSDNSVEYCGKVLGILRQEGISCELGYDRGKKVGKQIKAADKRRVPFVIIAGESEVVNSDEYDLKNVKVTVKRLIDGNERRLITLSECIKWIKE